MPLLTARRQHLAQRLGSLILITSLTIVTQAQTSIARGNSSASEERTSQYFETIRSSPLKQLAFLREMPKGGDLHNHLSGAIYAESYIQWAADKSLCIQQTTLTVLPGPCDSASGTIPAQQALVDTSLYDRLINAWSMRFWQYSGQNGHDHFFDTFGKFGEATNNQTGRMLAEAAARAAQSKLNYLELMITPASGLSKEIGKQVGWDGQIATTWQKLQDQGIAEVVAAGKAEISAAEAEKDRLLGCNTPQADPGCTVTIRYIAQVSRATGLERVFAQMVTGFMLGSDRTSKFVGVNLVQPEDNLQARQNFSVQMQMLKFLHEQYPQTHITLHAGEFSPGLVPPEEMRFHIRESVLTGQAERIGHGVDIMYETDPYGFLRDLAKRNVLIEICLGSNDLILGIRGNQHPLNVYLEHGVPVALATDDQGVARSEMSEEFLRAAQDQGLKYSQLKTLARNSLQYAFIPGQSLWQDSKTFTPIAPCQADWTSGRSIAQIESPACRDTITTSEKARLQWQLETSFVAFESQY